MKDEQNALIRAQEIRDQYDGRVSIQEICDKMVAENPTLGANALVDVVVGRAQKVPHLPEPEQGVLFEAREWYKIDDPSGWQWVPGNAIFTPELEAIFKKVIRNAKTQIFRGKRGLKDCKTVKTWDGYDPKLTHNENVRRFNLELEAKRTEAIEGGEQGGNQATLPTE